MYLVGLTGGIATGKSTVSKMLSDMGCPIVDADKIAREVVEPGTQGWKEIRATFGQEVFHEDGRLNRERLGHLIFSDPDKRRQLNAITHPKIYRAMVWQLLGLLFRGHQFAILDLPLLFETGKMTPYMTFTVVVSCNKEQQLQRLMTRNSYSEEEATSRINSQMSLEDKCTRATHVIDNSGDVEDTRGQVLDLYKQLCGSRAHWRLRIVLGSVLSAVISGIYFLMSLDDKCTRATHVIDNSGDVEDTRGQVLDLYKQLCGSRAHWRLRIVLGSVLSAVISGIYFLVR